MDKYSFSNFTVTSPYECEDAFRRKIKRAIRERIEGQFDFKVDAVAIGSSEIFVGVNGAKNDPYSVKPSTTSRIIKYHLYDGKAYEIDSWEAKLTHLVALPNASGLFAVYDDSDCWFINWATKKRIPLMKVHSKITHVTLISELSLVFFALNRSIFQFDAASDSTECRQIFLSPFDIKKMEPFARSNCMLLLSKEGSIQLLDLLGSCLVDVQVPRQFGNVSDFVVHTDQLKFVTCESNEVVLWQVIKQFPTENECTEKSLELNRKKRKTASPAFDIDELEEDAHSIQLGDASNSGLKTVEFDNVFDNLPQVKSKTEFSTNNHIENKSGVNKPLNDPKAQLRKKLQIVISHNDLPTDNNINPKQNPSTKIDRGNDRDSGSNVVSIRSEHPLSNPVSRSPKNQMSDPISHCSKNQSSHQIGRSQKQDHSPRMVNTKMKASRLMFKKRTQMMVTKTFTVKPINRYGTSKFKILMERKAVLYFEILDQRDYADAINSVLTFKNNDKVLLVESKLSTPESQGTVKDDFQSFRHFQAEPSRCPKILFGSFGPSNLYSPRELGDITYCRHSNWMVLWDESMRKFEALKLNKSLDWHFQYSEPIRNVFFNDSESSFFTWNPNEIVKWDLISHMRTLEWKIEDNIEFGSIIVHVYMDTEKEALFCCTNTYLLCFNTINFEFDHPPYLFELGNYSQMMLSKIGNSLLAVNCKDEFDLNIWQISANSIERMPMELVSSSPHQECTLLSESQKYELRIMVSKSNNILILGDDEMYSSNRKNVHESEITCLLVIDEEDRVLSGSEDSIAIWSIPDFAFIKRISHCNKTVSQMIALSNQTLLVHCSDDSLQYHNMQDMSLLYESQKSDAAISFIAFSAVNEQLLIFTDEMKVKVKTIKRSPVIRRVDGSINETFSLMKICKKTRILYCVASSLHLITCDPLTLDKQLSQSLSMDSNCLEFSEKYNLLFTMDDKGLLASDLATLLPLMRIYTTSSVVDTFVLEKSDRICLIYEDGLIEIRHLPGLGLTHTDTICVNFELSAACVSQESETMFIGTSTGRILAWDTCIPFLPREFGFHSEIVVCLTVSDAKNILVSSTETVAETKIWDAKELKLLRVLSSQNSLYGILFKENMDIFFAIDGTNRLTVWSSSSFEQLDMSFKFLEGNSINSIACTSDDNDLYINYWDQKRGENKLMRCDLSQFFQPTYFEKIFICQFFTQAAHFNKFATLFPKFESIYNESFLLKKCFNIYLSAAMQKQQKAFAQLWRDERQRMDFSQYQINPLLFLLKSNQLEFLQNILAFLNKRKVLVVIDEELMAFLLKGAGSAGLFFLAQNIKALSRFEHSNSEFEKLGHFKKYTCFKLSSRGFNEENYEQMKALSSKKNSSIGIEVYDMHVKWEFANFSESSIAFLEAYSISESDEFVLSPYRNVISAKWRQLYLYFLSHSVIYWLHVFLYFLFLLNSDLYVVMFIDLMILVVLSLYEALDICANQKSYFENYWNYLDILNIIMCATVLFMNLDDHSFFEFNSYKIFLLISLVIVTFRGFTFFKVFSEFSHITQMTIAMMQNSLSLTVILFYFSLCFSVMMAKIQDKKSFSDSLRINYDMIFGTIIPFDEFDYLFVVVVLIGSLMLPVFLINFLIAKLSGTYTQLENRQKVLAFKEVAITLKELEVIGRFVLRLLRRKIGSEAGFIYLGIDANADSEVEEINRSENLMKILAAEQKEQHQMILKQIQLLSQSQVEHHREQREQLREQQKLQSQQVRDLKNQLNSQFKEYQTHSETLMAKMKSLQNLKQQPVFDTRETNVIRDEAKQEIEQEEPPRISLRLKLPILSPQYKSTDINKPFLKKQRTYLK